MKSFRLTVADATASVPTEVLLDIFKLVSRDHFYRTSTCSIPGLDREGKLVRWRKEEDIDMRDDTLFPYNLANVCQRWNDIMHCCPEWWTRFRVFMDRGTRESIISDFSHQIELTRKLLPLRVFVGNSSKDVKLDPQAERCIIADIVGIAKSHLLRMESIIIQATNGSSLPLISSGVFSGPSPLLSELILECSSYPVIQSCPQPIIKLPVSDPNPKYFHMNLTLDGPTFIDSLFVPEFWTNCIAGNRDVSLHISHLRADSTFEANDIMEVLSYNALGIRDITLENVEILPSREKPNLNSFETIPTSYNFVAMSDFSFMLPLIEYHERLEQLCFNNCRIKNFPTFSNHIILLGLENMPDSEDLADIILRANPAELYIENCPNFDDFTLGVIGHYQGEGTNICHTFRRLFIQKGKTGVTAGGLKRFVYGRRRIAAEYYNSLGEELPPFVDDYDWDGIWFGEPTPLHMLQVNDAGYELSEEDRHFFTASTINFKWKP